MTGGSGEHFSEAARGACSLVAFFFLRVTPPLTDGTPRRRVSID